MSSISIAGDTSGSVILQAPSVAGSTTLTLPSTSGTIITTGGGAAGSFTTLTSSADASFATSSGSVGVGTSSPSTYSTKLGVKTAADQDSLAYFGGSSYATRIGVNSSFAVIEGVDAATGTSSYQPFCVRGSQLLFNTGGTERMRINNSWQLCIRQTSNSGGEVLGINGGGDTQIGLYSTGTSAYANINFRNGNGAVGQIVTNGSSTSYNTSSDYRLKQDVLPMVDALNRIMSLNPVTYKWKADGSDGEGFIAHELQEIFPQAVIGKKDETKIVDVKDEEGNVIRQEVQPIYQGVDTSFLVATLTAAIQELTVRVQELEAKVGK